jgi:hypothetical protein
MNRIQKIILFCGIGLLVIVALILSISPAMIFSPTYTITGKNYRRVDPDRVVVTTKTDFSSGEQLSKLPLKIGKWDGTDYDTAYTQKALNTNSVLMRLYEPDTFTQPLFLTIVQAETNASIHRIDMGCLVDQGFTLQENDEEKMVLSDFSQVSGEPIVTIPLHKVVATKQSTEGKIIERDLFLIFYVTGNRYYDNKITLIYVQGLVPITGGYSDTMQEEKGFLTELLPLLFQPTTSHRDDPLLIILYSLGIKGYVLIAILFLVPLSMIIYPVIKGKSRGKV